MATNPAQRHEDQRTCRHVWSERRIVSVAVCRDCGADTRAEMTRTIARLTRENEALTRRVAALLAACEALANERDELRSRNEVAHLLAAQGRPRARRTHDVRNAI